PVAAPGSGHTVRHRHRTPEGQTTDVRRRRGSPALARTARLPGGSKQPSQHLLAVGQAFLPALALRQTGMSGPPPPLPVSAKKGRRLHAAGREKTARLLFPDLLIEPGPRQRPEPVGGPAADAEGLGGLLMAEPREIAEFDQLGRRC